METPMRIDARGQVIIPEEIRRQAGLQPDSEVEIEFDGGAIRIVPRDGRHFGFGQPLLTPEEIRALLGNG